MLQTLRHGQVSVQICTGKVEPVTLTQLQNIARQPIAHRHAATMSDVHVGIGTNVGSVIPTKGIIIPAVVVGATSAAA